jgi:hypothetical protein
MIFRSNSRPDSAVEPKKHQNPLENAAEKRGDEAIQKSNKPFWMGQNGTGESLTVLQTRPGKGMSCLSYALKGEPEHFVLSVSMKKAESNGGIKWLELLVGRFSNAVRKMSVLPTPGAAGSAGTSNQRCVEAQSKGTITRK